MEMKNNREQLLIELQQIVFAVFLTNLINEYCYELIILTSNGIKYQWIGYDDWTVYRLKSCEHEKWIDIRNKIQNGSIALSDLNDTEFMSLINCTIGKDVDCNYTILLKRLGDMPTYLQDELFCYFEPETQSFFFAADQEELKKKMASVYCIDTSWAEMDTDDLERWLERYKEEGQDIPCNFFSEEE